MNNPKRTQRTRTRTFNLRINEDGVLCTVDELIGLRANIDRALSQSTRKEYSLSTTHNNVVAIQELAL